MAVRNSRSSFDEAARLGAMVDVDHSFHGPAERDAHDGLDLELLDASDSLEGLVALNVRCEDGEPRLLRAPQNGAADRPARLRHAQVEIVSGNHGTVAVLIVACQNADVLRGEMLDDRVLDRLEDLPRAALLEELPPDAVERPEALGRCLDRLLGVERGLQLAGFAEISHRQPHPASIPQR